METIEFDKLKKSDGIYQRGLNSVDNFSKSLVLGAALIVVFLSGGSMAKSASGKELITPKTFWQLVLNEKYRQDQSNTYKVSNERSWEYPEVTENLKLEAVFKDIDQNMRVTPPDRGFIYNKGEKNKEFSDVYVDVDLFDEYPTDFDMEVTGSKKEITPSSQDEAERIYSKIAAGTEIMSGWAPKEYMKGQVEYDLEGFFPSGTTPTEPKDFWEQVMKEGEVQEDGKTYILDVGGAKIPKKVEHKILCRYVDENGDGEVNDGDSGAIIFQSDRYFEEKHIKSDLYKKKDIKPTSYKGMKEVVETVYKENFTDIFSDEKVKDFFTTYKQLLKLG